MTRSKVLFMGRYGDPYSIKIHNFLVKKFYKVTVHWSKGITHKPNRFIKKKWKGDYIFCFRSYYILNQKLISRAKIAAINFHPGPPEYRGTGCLNYAMYRNEKYYGTTAHLMLPKVDNGKIINVKRFKILKRNSVETLLNKTHKILLNQALEVINLLHKNHKNLNKLIHRSKNEKWSKKMKKRKHLDQFYNINTTYNDLIKKIRACYIQNSFRPYIMLHNFKFVLDSPHQNKMEKNKKYKMYFKTPSDLIKKK